VDVCLAPFCDVIIPYGTLLGLPCLFLLSIIPDTTTFTSRLSSILLLWLNSFKFPVYDQLNNISFEVVALSPHSFFSAANVYEVFSCSTSF